MTRTEATRLHHHRISLMMLLALSCLVVLPAWALPGDRDQPMTITADEGNFKSSRGEATFTGNVYLKQGTLEVWADTLDVRRDPETGDITFLEAKANPHATRNCPVKKMA